MLTIDDGIMENNGIINEKVNFLPIELMLRRVEASQEEADMSYFYDLISLGEMVTKFTAIFLVENIENDVERTRYRFEYQLVRADGIGDFAQTINSIATGSPADYLPLMVCMSEIVQLNSKIGNISWQKDALDNLGEVLNALNIQANAFSPKSSLRLWFSNFSELRNKTKGHGSPTPAQCSKVVAPLAKSIKTIYENLNLFKRNWAYLHQNQTGKYRVSEFGGSKGDFDYLKRNKDYNLQEGVYLFTDRPHKVELIASDEGLTKFMIVNGNFNSNSLYEVHDYYQNINEKVSGDAYLDPPSKLPNSVTGGAEMTLIGGGFTNLPITFDDYIQRQELESELRKVLIEEDRYPIATLKGRGGIGKTSLALYVIKDVLNNYPDRFDIVVWFSSRDIDLTPEGPKQVQAVVVNQQDIAMEYFRQIGEERASTKGVVDDFSAELTKNAMGKALYVFDNFETLTNPVEIYEWLNTYVRNPNKILITSRLNRNFKADYPVEVKGMNDSQCRELIASTARKLAITDLLDDNYVASLIETSDGHPYIIKIILGEVAKTGKATQVKRIVAEKDNVLDALFKRTYTTLSAAAKRVYLTLCSWHSVIPYIALESVVLRDDNESMDFDAAIEELEKSSLIEVTERKDDMFISVPLAAAIYGSKELEVSPMKIQIMNDRKLLMEFGAGSEKGRLTLESHIVRKTRAMRLRITSEEMFLKELPSMELLASKYPQIWKDIADFYHRFGRAEKEKECFRELLKVTNNPDHKLNLWKSLSRICMDYGDWEGESSALLEIVGIPLVPYEDISFAAYRVNKYYSENSIDSDLTRNYLIQLIIEKMEQRIKEANAADCSRLAWLCLNMQDEAKALKYAQKGLRLDNANKHCIRLVQKLQTK